MDLRGDLPRMSGRRLFLLGSGFSRAVSQEMPTVGELREYLHETVPRLRAYDPAMARLIHDPEMLLSYLMQRGPWKAPGEAEADYGAFLELSSRLGSFIRECETRAFKTPAPSWAKEFASLLHLSKSTVVTLNYDTVLERLSRHLETPDGRAVRTADLYGLPLAHLAQRTAGYSYYPRSETYRLLKIHGSTNWYYTGDNSFAAQQVYYVEVNSDSPETDDGDIADLLNQNTPDLTPLIVPPVSEKASLYSTRLLRILWSEFRNAVDAADELFLVGYSFPPSDYTMSMFLSSLDFAGKTVEIVNRTSEPAFTSRIQRAFRGAEVRTTYSPAPDAVERMVRALMGGAD